MLKGFKCPEGIKHAENGVETDKHSFAFCLNQCPSPCFPTPLLEVICQTNDRDVHKGKMISTTALQGCFRALWLERNKDYYVNPASLWYTTRGTLIHSIVTEQDTSRFISEKRFYLKVGDDTISGQIDLYDIDKEILYDFKTIGDKGLSYIIDDGPKEAHVWQTNIYKYLMRHGFYIDSNTDKHITPKLKVKQIKIIYLTMMSALTTGEVYYPVFAGKKPRFSHIKDVKILKDKFIAEYIEAELPILSRIMDSKDEPDFIPDEQTQGWQCGFNYKGKGYCKVKELCSFWKQNFTLEDVP